MKTSSAIKLPNVLFVHSDQHRYDCVGANGHPFLRTPHLDSLARQGINFSHAFCPTPLCVPARASLLTGQWPIQHLSIANWDTEAPRPFADGIPTFSEKLREHGYQLGYVGKWHVHPQKDPRMFGFHDYNSGEGYALWRKAKGLPPNAGHSNLFGSVDTHITAEQSHLAWGADRTLELLCKYHSGQKPFFLRWDPSEPHLPNHVPEPFASMYQPTEIPPWPGFFETFKNKPFIQRQQLRSWKIDGWEWRRWAPIVSRYLGEITLLDSQIGRILATLDELGLAENTLVIYTSDHGDMCGSHGMMDKHFVMYDDVVRVPLLARWPQVIRPGARCDAFVSSAIDLASSFCEVAGIQAGSSFKGESLLPLFRGHRTNGRKTILSMYQGNQFGLYSQRMARDRRWKYIWNATAEDELYDLVADPGELTNRIADPAAAAETQRLRRSLVSWLTKIRDPLFNQYTKSQLLDGSKS